MPYSLFTFYESIEIKNIWTFKMANSETGSKQLWKQEAAMYYIQARSY